MPEAPPAKQPVKVKPLLKARVPGYLRRGQETKTIRYTTQRPEVRQFLFAQHLAYGSLPGDAYKASHGDVIEAEKLNPKQISDRAKSLARSQKMQNAVNGFRDELRAYYSIMPEQWLHGMVLLRDKAVALGEIGPAVRAHELIGKAAGLFIERIQIERGQLTETEALAELKRIAEMNPDVARMILETQPRMLEAEVVHAEPESSTTPAQGEATATPASATTPAESSPTSQAG